MGSSGFDFDLVKPVARGRLGASLVAVALMTAPPAPLHAEDPGGSALRHTRPVTPSVEEMIFDGIVARPLGLVSTVIGAGLFVITLPFSAGGGNVDQARERFIDEPVWYTFRRCLGCFDEGYRRLPLQGGVHKGEQR
jgi:hypothetical protein